MRFLSYTIKHTLPWATLLHCLRKTVAHVALSFLHARAWALSSLHARACCYLYTARPRCSSSCLSLLRGLYTLPSHSSVLGKSRKKKFLQYSCLKMFFYLLVLKLTLFSCSEEISLFTRSFLASNLSALTNMFCLWVSKSASRAAVDWTSRLRTKIQKKKDATTTKHITLVALFLLPLFLVHRANDINDSK